MHRCRGSDQDKEVSSLALSRVRSHDMFWNLLRRLGREAVALRRAFAPCVFASLLAVAPWATQGPRVLPGLSDRSNTPDLDMPRPFAALDSVFLEELTWLEVRDALR